MVSAPANWPWPTPKTCRSIVAVPVMRAWLPCILRVNGSTSGRDTPRMVNVPIAW